MKKQPLPVVSHLRLAATSLLVLFATSMEAKEIFLAMHDYCPYSCPGEPRQGIFIDLLKAILEPEGYRVVLRERPWKRSVRDIQGSGHQFSDYVLTVSATSPVPGTVLSKKPLLFFQSCFVIRRGFDWRYQHQHPNTPVRLGVIDGVDYSALSDFLYSPNNWR